MTKFRQLALANLFGASMFVAFPAQAQTEPQCGTTETLLTTIISGGGCIIDDKLFFNFGATVALGNGTVDVTQFLTLTGTPEPVPDPLSEAFSLGLTFDPLTGLPVDFPAVTVSVLTPLVIGYSVRVLDPLFAITDIHLGIAAGTTGVVTETVTSGTEVIAVLQVGSDPLVGNFGNTAEEVFTGVGSIIVLKEITNLGVFGGGQEVTQEVTQGRVPEPGSLALFGLGLAGLALTRRRKQR